MQKRPQRAAQLRRQVVFTNGLQQRERGLVGLELRDASGTLGEVAFKIGVHVGRQLMFEIVREQPDDVGAGAIVRGMGQGASSTAKSQLPTPESLEVGSLGVGVDASV